MVSLPAGLLAVRPGWSEGLKVLQLDRAGWDEPCGSWAVVEVVLYMEMCVSHSLCWRKQTALRLVPASPGTLLVLYCMLIR